MLDVHIVLHLLGGQPLQLCVEFCHAVLIEKVVNDFILCECGYKSWIDIVN